MFLIENSSTLRQILRVSNGLDRLDAYHIPDAPTTFPIHFPTPEQLDADEVTEEELTIILNQTIGSLDEQDEDTATFRYNSIKDYHSCYVSKRKTPSEVAESLITAIQETSQLRAIVEFNAEDIREQARESTERFENNTPRSILEGIPISVKDQIHVRGLQTSKGRSYAEPTEC